jgi:hypothetical protein
MRRMLILLGAICLVTVVGCGDQPTVPNTVADTEPLPLTVPADVYEFFDEQLESEADTPETMVPFSASFSTEYDVYAVTFLWGHLGNGPVASIAPVDWSGTLSANAVVTIDVRHIIDFEPGEDSLLPVSSVATAEWVSQTGFDIDGLSFRVAVERGISYFAPPVLTFDTAPITLQLPFHWLEHYAAYYPVNNAGQGVVVLARRIWHGACPSGALRGEWIKETNTSDQGVFEGAWLDEDGNVTGVYAGMFWTNNDGTRKFYGWVSGGVTPMIIAEMRGVWGYDDPRLCPMCGDDHGWFRGKVRFLDHSGCGVVKGVFGDLTGAVDAAALPMVGVWKMICPFANGASTSNNTD